MICLQGSVKISTHVMTMLKRNLQAHNRILPIREFVREVKLHDPFMKLGCLDFGTKCIGTAATDETKQFTFPVGVIPVKQPPKTAESLLDLHRQLQEFSKKENIRYIVVGFPMMPGASKEMTPLGHHIIWSIQGMPQVGVALTFCMWDEEYSTSEAKAAIKSVSGKKNVVLKHKDAVAASIILKNFLNSYRF